ncbi:MAG: hypothetical protein OXE84_12040 [Rhodobacteraceae bacterium]|nr:hypothetical protein [Paracoccaceae bacterium]MCY4195820.1 hypothetical protein [Paracoccaceae bacterium]
MHLFEILGFKWNRSAVPDGVPASVDRVVFLYKQILAQFVFDASSLEGNPFTYPEVKTLLDGVTVGGHKLTDERQVLNLAAAAKELFSLVKTGSFRLDKTTFDRLHALVAHEEPLEWGCFRGEGEFTDITPRVGLGYEGEFVPFHLTEPGAENLKRLFDNAVQALEAEVHDPRERGMAFFLFGALQQFYFDGNKRTSRFMMNGILMSNGMDAISVPAARATEFNEKMVRFYTSKDATEMIRFLIDCQPKNAPTPKPTSNSGPSM